MIFNMLVTEYLEKTVRVEAKDESDAYNKVLDLICTERVVLTADDFTDRDIKTVGDGFMDNSLTNDESYNCDLDFTEETK